MPEDFTDHQWQRLVDAGPQIALAVAASAGSAGQSETELGAFLHLVDETADDSDNAGLLGRLAAAARDKVASGMLTGNSDDAIPDGIHAAREAGAILAVAADEADARAVRQWLLQVAHTTATAAREGGVLGIGGKEVSDRERDTLAEIADGLGTSGEPEGEMSEAPGSDTGAGDPEIGSDGEPVGSDNIRDGTVRGTMGGSTQTQGGGQG